MEHIFNSLSSASQDSKIHKLCLHNLLKRERERERERERFSQVGIVFVPVLATIGWKLHTLKREEEGLRGRGVEKKKFQQNSIERERERERFIWVGHCFCTSPSYYWVETTQTLKREAEGSRGRGVEKKKVSVVYLF